MPIRKKKIEIDGKEIEVDVYDTRLIPGSGKEEEAIESLYREEEMERAIRDALKKIETIAKRYSNKKKNLQYYHKVGKVLQFVDKKGYTDSRLLIWHRMAYDLRPDLFDLNLDHFDNEKKAIHEAKRRADIMYHIGKQSETNLKRATWDQWYEIIKFKSKEKKWLYKDKSLLEKILVECEKSKSAGPRLRKKIEEIRKSKTRRLLKKQPII